MPKTPKTSTKRTKKPLKAKSGPTGSSASEAVVLTTVTPKAAPKPPKQAKKPTKPEKIVHPKAKMTFRHNALPPILGILVFIGVLGLFNGQWLQAQYQYRYAKPAVIDEGPEPATTDPNAAPQLYIPSINVTAPVVTSVKTYDESSVQVALRSGAVQYGASVDPGQKGNVVIIGHSSGQLWTPGDYKFVFTLLDKMAVNDRILLDFKGKRYIYRVSDSKVVPPTDISVLKQTDEPQLTLITCTPVGTSKNRRIITARQISPKPDTATAVDKSRAIGASVLPL